MEGAAVCVGVDRRTLTTWINKGCPGKADGCWPVSRMLEWERSRKSITDPIDGDPLLGADGDSPALEEYRRAKAALARLDLAEREKQLVRVEDVVGPLMEAAAVVRAAGERIGREYGPEAQEVINEAVGEFLSGLKRAGGEGE